LYQIFLRMVNHFEQNILLLDFVILYYLTFHLVFHILLMVYFHFLVLKMFLLLLLLLIFLGHKSHYILFHSQMFQRLLLLDFLVLILQNLLLNSFLFSPFGTIRVGSFWSHFYIKIFSPNRTKKNRSQWVIF